MNIKVLQYIDNTQKNNITTGQAAVTGDNISYNSSSAVNSTGTDFDQVLDDAKMAEAAVAIDRLIAQSNGGSVDMSLVQRFFDQNGINIELCRNTVSPSAAVNNTAAYSGSPAINRGSVKLEASGLSCSADLDAIFNEAASKYGVDAKFLKAIAKCESDFSTECTSRSGAMGIMQLMPSTASAYGVSDPYDAYQNIMGGAAVLKDLLNMFQGNQSLAIAGYNAGCGNVKKYGGVPPFTETQNYVAKVTSLMQTGVSVPANTVTVNPSANTSSNTGTATSENFNTSNEATVSSETAKKNAEILAEIISAISTLTTNQSTYSNTSMQSGLSALNGTSASDFSAGSLLSSYGNPISTILSSLQNVDTTDTDSLQKVLSYAEYQLLTSHYTNMVDIISVLGSTGLSTENDSDDSLSHLFELATQQNMRKVINVMGNSTSLL